MVLSFAHHKEATFKDGCLSLRKSVLDKMLSTSAPGAIYNPKPRVSSTEKCLRNITFGTAPARYNDVPTKGKRRTKQASRHLGPMSYDPGAIRKAIYMLSTQKSAGGVKFGCSKRDNTPKNQNPSPAEYDPELIRRGIMFSKNTSASHGCSFGTATNNDLKKNGKPGPATYDPEAIRTGIMRTKSSMPSVKFGSPPKKSSRKSEASMRCPGPQEYDTENIRRGVYCLSTKRRPRGVKFSTGPRTSNDLEEKERASKPGPSTYEIPSGLGHQVNSRYKSQPSISFGSR